ncbi:hypothetical protein [Streptomyces gardneri]|uniref:Uncharacterized protein n=1 Tax=Streptomyces gardneri TaxID=66892 RepID=A0A4Y3RKN8_9ACTN|nr:hypothetical protein [Streptomyces gardneri]GEB58195.1 hypothetical protein SGA01_38000 [Streptomyces gardneri]GHH17466.1 hypothetical protein GCM10017674_68460 [Streptomyces gardneri]
MTTPWTRAAEDDPLDGLRTALAEADCGYEPEGGYEDRCWILHRVHDGPVRLRWDEVLARAGRRLAEWPGTLSYLVFEGVEGAGELEGPDPAELDRASLDRLVEHLARSGPQGPDTPCGAAQAVVATPPGGQQGMWRGRLGDAPAHYDAMPEFRFPATWWAADGRWLVLTDWDLSATEVFGDAALITALLADPELDVVRHPSIAESLGG